MPGDAPSPPKVRDGRREIHNVRLPVNVPPTLGVTSFETTSMLRPHLRFEMVAAYLASFATELAKLVFLCAWGVVVDEVDQAFDCIHGSGRKNSMPKVENVARAPGRSFKNVLRSLLQKRPRGHKRDWIQVPLNGASLAYPRPGIIQSCPPVDTHHISSRLPHER